MKCPLLAITDERVGRVGFPQGCDCIKEECAWWDRQRGCCLFGMLCIYLERLTGKLSQLVTVINERMG